MALPTSGPISFQDIEDEFDGAHPISMAEYYGADAYGLIPNSGTIAMSNFHGAVNKAPPGSTTYEANDTFVVPAGYTTVTVTMIGGGGGGGYYSHGGIHSHGFYGGGGYSGVIVQQNVTVTPNGSYSIIIGAGGYRNLTSYVWVDSTSSKFGTLTANGGARGDVDGSDYLGNGGQRTTVFGTFRDGYDEATYGTQYAGLGKGGQAGFANGGSSNYWDGSTRQAEDGIRGSGGGAGTSGYHSHDGLEPGQGGKGLVKVSWGL